MARMRMCRATRRGLLRFPRRASECSRFSGLAQEIDQQASTLALYLGAQTAEALVDALEAAVDLADVLDHGFALGAEGGDQHGHAGANIRAGQPGTTKFGRTDDHCAVRIAEDDLRAHRDEVVHEEQA